MLCEWFVGRTEFGFCHSQWHPISWFANRPLEQQRKAQRKVLMPRWTLLFNSIASYLYSIWWALRGSTVHLLFFSKYLCGILWLCASWLEFLVDSCSIFFGGCFRRLSREFVAAHSRFMWEGDAMETSSSDFRVHGHVTRCMQYALLIFPQLVLCYISMIKTRVWSIIL